MLGYMSKQNTTLLVIFIGVLVMSALASYLYLGGEARQERETKAPAPSATSTARGAVTSSQNQQAQTTDNENNKVISQVLGMEEPAREPVKQESWYTVLVRALLRLMLAALLTAILAFRPRKFSVLFKRNLFVAQTQILLAVVASALMMVVGDSAARAFGIFAAVSLVRFRTNIKDPKEITVLLVSLAIGLATGVGRWELAFILSMFVLLLLWALEYRESEMVFRAMELKIRTRNLIATHEVIRGILKKYGFSSEIRVLNREDEKDPFGCVVFCVEVSPQVSTDELSAEILASDQVNIDSIEWEQQKSSSAYQ
jgi:uncharacterized membrane protein YhiD involved in acid resistance